MSGGSLSVSGLSGRGKPKQREEGRIGGGGLKVEEVEAKMKGNNGEVITPDVEIRDGSWPRV